MLRELNISNYALIDMLRIEFTPGLNIITGETGAGKSIILGALGLLLGARADLREVKSTQRKSVVEAVFNVKGHTRLAEYCRENDLDWDDSDCILRREIQPTGRSRAFVNDTPVSLAILEAVSQQLIDIHSQNQNRLLSSADFQRDVIDCMAGNQLLMAKYAMAYKQMRSLRKQLQLTMAQIADNQREEEFIRFQLQQLDDARLTPGEQAELEKERDILANMTDIKEALSTALELITDGRSNALSQLAQAGYSLEELTEVIDDAASLAQRLESARVEIQDIAETLTDYNVNLQADPSELADIEDRLSTLYSLQHRFKVDTEQALIAKREELRQRLAMIEDSDVTIGDLRKQVEAAQKRAAEIAAEITRARKAAADTFAARLQADASPLGMANLRCLVAVEPAAELLPSGADTVEFRFAFNKNQTPVPASASASGGEVSRLMLCIKSIIAGRLQLPTVIFDEVDTGVSGDVGNRMGDMMRAMSADLQVITITHLPQVAAKGVSHFKVFKEDDELSTHTRIRRLTDADRPAEIATMLSGSATDPSALATARSLLSK